MEVLPTNQQAHGLLGKVVKHLIVARVERGGGGASAVCRQNTEPVVCSEKGLRPRPPRTCVLSVLEGSDWPVLLASFLHNQVFGQLGTVCSQRLASITQDFSVWVSILMFLGPPILSFMVKRCRDEFQGVAFGPHTFRVAGIRAKRTQCLSS